VRAAQHLLERQIELAACAELAGLASSGTGGVLLLAGPAGIGKTSLIQAWLPQAETRQMQVLSARASELEHDFPFGVVRQLFELPLASLPDEEQAEVLSGAAGLAAPLLSDRQLESEQPSPDAASYAALHGLYWLTANLAARRPLVLVVDDVHWSDAPSLRFLDYLIRRIDELPILLVLAARPREPESETELLEAIASAPLVRRVELAPLSQLAVAKLVRGEIPSLADDDFCRACHHATRGNPFYLRELLSALAEEESPSTAAGAARISELGPSTVARSVLRRLRRLPPAAAALARAVALLGDGADLGIAAELAELDRSVAAEASDALVRADVLSAEPLMEFAHPIVRAAIYQDLAPRDRARGHARAARMLAAQGADVDRVAMHLLAGEPSGDPQVVQTLREAARGAVARGAPEVAATYLRRSSRIRRPEIAWPN
jgi:predicted ATPase